jgi:hypothetical protein
MEPEDSLPYSQQSYISPYPEPDQSSPYISILAIQDPSWNSKIWGFHGGGYEECRLLGYYAVWLL